MKSFIKIRGDIGRKCYISGTILSFTCILFLWYLLSANSIVDKTFLPLPTDVVSNFIGSIKDYSLITNMEISIFRISVGFLLAAVIGVPLGILVGSFKIIESVVQPFTEFARYMPVPAFVPLIMVWVGIGEEAKIAVIFIGTLFQLVLMAADNVRSVPDDILNAAYTLGASKRQVLLKILIPHMMPKLMDTLRLMIGWAWTYLVVAELVAANSGLGYSILKAQRFLKTDAIFSGLLVIGLLGLITDRLFALLNKSIFSWAEGGGI